MPNNLTIQVLYFASLAEQANKDDETLDTTDSTPCELYQSLQAKYQFGLSMDKIAVAINHQIADWHTPLGNKDIVAFIPPVAGG